MGKQDTGRQRHSPSAPLSGTSPLLRFGNLLKPAKLPWGRIERLFLPCELWKSKGTLSSSRGLDCPPISRRSRGSSPSDERLLLAPLEADYVKQISQRNDFRRRAKVHRVRRARRANPRKREDAENHAAREWSCPRLITKNHFFSKEPEPWDVLIPSLSFLALPNNSTDP